MSHIKITLRVSLTENQFNLLEKIAKDKKLKEEPLVDSELYRTLNSLIKNGYVKVIQGVASHPFRTVKLSVVGEKILEEAKRYYGRNKKGRLGKRFQ